MDTNLTAIILFAIAAGVIGVLLLVNAVAAAFANVVAYVGHTAEVVTNIAASLRDVHLASLGAVERAYADQADDDEDDDEDLDDDAFDDEDAE